MPVVMPRLLEQGGRRQGGEMSGGQVRPAYMKTTLVIGVMCRSAPAAVSSSHSIRRATTICRVAIYG